MNITKLDYRNSKQLWDKTLKKWIHVPLCDNAVSNISVNSGRGLGFKQCYNNEAKIGGFINKKGEKYAAVLCEECLETLKRIAPESGYSIKIARHRE
ncbi:MAG: hypothetical protein QXL24_08065 [Candidatus Jordarchaeaceae archaeon]